MFFSQGTQNGGDTNSPSLRLYVVYFHQSSSSFSQIEYKDGCDQADDENPKSPTQNERIVDTSVRFD